MKLLRKIGEYVAMAIGFPIIVVCFLASVGLLGLLILSVPVWIVSLFSKHLADSLDHLMVPDWPLHLGFAIPVAAGCLAFLCWSRISYLWERKRVIEQEIKTVSDIQIIEPSPPGPVEHFAKRVNDAFERFCQRYFGWTETVGDKFEEIWEMLPYVVKVLCVITLGFVVGAITLWVRGTSFHRPWLTIPGAVVVGWIVIYFAIMGLALLFVAISIPFAVPVIAWISAKQIIEWVARNLPRGPVIRYHQWRLRHGFVKGRSLDWLTALVAISLIVIALGGLKACSNFAPSGDEDSEDVQTDY